MNTLIGAATALVGLAAAILGIFKYFDVRSKREQREAIGAAFKAIITTLAGKDRVERLGSAILLRRFFSTDSEYAKPDMPYGDEAIDVIAATLRGEPTGDVQKVLADGLAYVAKRDLRHKDFQHVNLRGAYLSLEGPAGHVENQSSSRNSTYGLRGIATRATKQGRSRDHQEDRPRLDLSNADFFRADVSEASFANDICVGTVFYGSIAAGSIFREADLTEANFVDADLRKAKFNGALLAGAKFDGADLTGANFTGARQLPPEIAERLDKGIYRAATRETSDANGVPHHAKVFLSVASVSSPTHEALVELIGTSLQDEGFEIVRVSRDAHHPGRHLTEVKEAMAGCAGVVVIGLPQLLLSSGTWREGTDDEQPLADQLLHTPWNDIETGIGVGLGLPVLAVRAGCGEFGVFGLSSQNAGFERIEPEDSWTNQHLAESVRSWSRTALR